METTELSETSLNIETEAQLPWFKSRSNLGGWVTFPFISGGLMGVSIAQSGVLSNLIVYLIKEYNVKSIDATQIYNIVNGCMSIAPVVGAIISDSFFGCFSVVTVSTFASFLGMILFTFTATVGTLRPAHCNPGNSSLCPAASVGQKAVFYLAVALMSVGAGGARFNAATLGANQFDRATDHDIFFNWFFFMLYLGSVIGATVIVYVEDTVSWGLGLGLCSIANAIGFVAFVAGSRYYRRSKPEGSPFIGLARVLVAAVRKSKMAVSQETQDYYCGNGEGKPSITPPTQRYRLLNKAALKVDGDTNFDGSSVRRPWRLCTVEQVEDLKSIVSILPLWATAIFLAVSIGIQGGLTVLQALTVDRSLGNHFSVPAGSLTVSSLATIAIVLPLLDRAILPTFRRLSGHSPTPLQRIGLGHILNTTSMAISALVERRRLMIVQARGLVDQPDSTVPMTVLWLVLPLVVLGMGEALHFPGQVALYYQEFPKALRSTSTGMIALIVALGFYLSTAVVDLVRRLTDWLPDNINAGRMDNVYWMLTIVGAFNFGLYVLCAKVYKCQSTVEDKDVADKNIGFSMTLDFSHKEGM